MSLEANKVTVSVDSSGVTSGTQSTQAYAADLVDRTEGNQNWGETGGDLGSRATQQDLKDMANETATVARQNAPLTEKGKEALSQAADYAETAKETLKRDAEMAKETLKRDAELAKEKLSQTYEAGAQKIQATRDHPAETSQSMVDKLKESVENTTSTIQHKTHEWAESAQHTLEHARDKAREVFTGAGQKVEQAQSKLASSVKGTSTTTGDATKVNVTTYETPTGGIDSVKVESRTTSAQ